MRFLGKRLLAPLIHRKVWKKIILMVIIQAKETLMSDEI